MGSPSVSGGCAMGTDRIRYLLFLKGRWRWRPTKTMRAAGFRMVNLSHGLLVNGRPAPTAVTLAKNSFSGSFLEPADVARHIAAIDAYAEVAPA